MHCIGKTNVLLYCTFHVFLHFLATLSLPWPSIFRLQRYCTFINVFSESQKIWVASCVFTECTQRGNVIDCDAQNRQFWKFLGCRVAGNHFSEVFECGTYGVHSASLSLVGNSSLFLQRHCLLFSYSWFNLAFLCHSVVPHISIRFPSLISVSLPVCFLCSPSCACRIGFWFWQKLRTVIHGDIRIPFYRNRVTFMCAFDQRNSFTW